MNTTNDKIQLAAPSFVISIPLNGKNGEGKYVLVDFDRYQEIKQYSLCEHEKGWGKKYVQISLGARGLQYSLHRYIMSVHEHSEFEVDHIDGDPYNNTRANLRLTTHQQNMCNQNIRCDNVSGLKGVYYLKDVDQYQAKISHCQRHIDLGRYDSCVEAGRAYDDGSRRYHGEFGKTNEELGLYTRELIERDLRESYQRKRNKIEKPLPLISYNTSGCYGVSFDKSRNKWQVQYKGKYIGRYNTKEEAIDVSQHLQREEVQMNINALDREYDRKWVELQSN